MKHTIIVIGGGAAGMIAAIEAARQKHSVILIEKNEKLGKKVYITGKGRCNLTNACEVEEVFANIVSNPKFMYSSIYGFDNHQTMEYFERLGVPLKVERGNRVFPVSDHSSDVIKVLQQELRRLQVQVHLHTEVTDLVLDRTSEEHIFVKGVCLKGGKTISCDRLILATGGCSYPATGSTGDGYRILSRHGHSIRECQPSLVPFITEEAWCKDVMGLTLKNVRVTLKCGKKEVYEGFGELLFTHFGLSGPLVLSASAYIGKYYGEPMELILDLKPALSEEQLDQRLQKDFIRYQNRQLIHALDDLLPKKLIPHVVRASGIPEEKRVNGITRQERKCLIDALKALTFHVTGTRGFEEAIITRGGVAVKEIDPHTMESKLISGLYVAGEVLNVDAVTGGFNLQIAWSTGYAAGQAAGAFLEDA